MSFNEDSRVKIPSILHLVRLGYEYLSLKSSVFDEETNIFTNIFHSAIAKINPTSTEHDRKQLYTEIKLCLENEDLGKAFYEKLIAKSGLKLIDFDDFSNNIFNVVTELTYKNNDEEFRPDITLLINGLPLVFIEVKKPNNKDGLLSERDRMTKRLKNKKFRRFANITQIMLFSNNMEYDSFSPLPIQGAFYATSSYDVPIFNFFREENKLEIPSPINQSIVDFILKDNHLQAIKNSPEFIENNDPSKPTNRLCTSLLSHERLAFFLQYAIVYLNNFDGIQKHIMRYPQFFATKAIEKRFNDDKFNTKVRKGIIWHTQGSGKTALAYYNTRFLTDYFQKKDIIPKFYFIVDRLDLLEQAMKEFSARGLIVHKINTREEFAKDIKKIYARSNDKGKPEITVVNIQKFSDDQTIIKTDDYNLNIQRVYFLDEVHRSYSPKGSFLANLILSDKNAIQIGLTGTPLLGNDYTSRTIFGGYIHKYYYNSSIADGYTLRLIREEISTDYKIALKEALASIKLKQGDIERKSLYAHKSFVSPLLDYILEDFSKSQTAFNDKSIGAMVICDSSEQAKMLYDLFEQSQSLKENKKTAKLILHDVDSKEERKKYIEDFKDGKYDFLFVYNMLLTGFDAPRLKKLYLGRVIKKHNLLQALTRVNRPYKNFPYGYIVDFADISKEFEATNEAYLLELESELGDEMENYSKLFKTTEEIKQEIEEIKEELFRFDTKNAEKFSAQISQIQDRSKLLTLKKVLANARSLYNIIKLQGEYDFLHDLDFQKLNKLYNEVNNHLDLLNLKLQLESNSNTENLLNLALEDIHFMFRKISESELVLADQLKDTLRKTREALLRNFDQQDIEFITLKEELERLFKKKKLNSVSQEEINENILALNDIFDKITKLNQLNDLLKDKYEGDYKFARLHKRILTEGLITKDFIIHSSLMDIKNQLDTIVLQNNQVLQNESYFNKTAIPLTMNAFQNNNFNANNYKNISNLIIQEYINEYTTGNRTGAF